MKKKNKIILLISSLILILLAWAPWISNNYAINKVIEDFGGSDKAFTDFHGAKTIGEAKFVVSLFPFGRSVSVPSEAVWFVTFYGDVI